MCKHLTSKELVDRIVCKVASGGKRLVSHELGVSSDELMDIVNFKQGVSKEVAFRLGYLPKLMWIKKPQDFKGRDE